MYPVSELFDRRVRQGGHRKTVVDVYYDGNLIRSDLPVTDGSLHIDAGSAVRRAGTITVADPTLVPLFVRDVLSPYGTEITVKQGLVYPNGLEELVPLGRFILWSTEWEESTGAIPVMELFDRAKILEQAEVQQPLSFSGWVAADVFERYSQKFFGQSAVVSPALDNYKIPGGHVIDGGNHFEAIRTIATAMGGDVYFDVDGVMTVSPKPVFNDETTVLDSVWDVDSGDYGTLVSARRRVTRENTYSSVYVVGALNPKDENTTAEQKVPSSHATNTEPSSPTYIRGPFGDVGKTISDSTLTSPGKCHKVAQRKLLEYQRLSRTLEFSCIPNPALQEYDVVTVKYLDGSTSVGMIESLQIPLAAGAYTGVCSNSRV